MVPPSGRFPWQFRRLRRRSADVVPGGDLRHLRPQAGGRGAAPAGCAGLLEHGVETGDCAAGGGGGIVQAKRAAPRPAAGAVACHAGKVAAVVPPDSYGPGGGTRRSAGNCTMSSPRPSPASTSASRPSPRRPPSTPNTSTATSPARSGAWKNPWTSSIASPANCARRCWTISA